MHRRSLTFSQPVAKATPDGALNLLAAATEARFVPCASHRPPRPRAQRVAPQRALTHPLANHLLPSPRCLFDVALGPPLLLCAPLGYPARPGALGRSCHRVSDHLQVCTHVHPRNPRFLNLKRSAALTSHGYDVPSGSRTGALLYFSSASLISVATAAPCLCQPARVILSVPRTWVGIYVYRAGVY